MKEESDRVNLLRNFGANPDHPKALAMIEAYAEVLRKLKRTE